jgi:hypothetical protein
MYSIGVNSIVACGFFLRPSSSHNLGEDYKSGCFSGGCYDSDDL